MCAHLLTLSLSFPPSPYLWVFPLYCFPPEGSTFHMATSLVSALFGPTQKDHFPQEAPRLSQRGLGLTQLDLLSWVPLIPFCFLTLLSHHSVSVSHSHFYNFFLFKICFNKHVFSARRFSRMLFRLGPSGSRFMRVFLHRSQWHPSSKGPE